MIKKTILLLIAFLSIPLFSMEKNITKKETMEENITKKEAIEVIEQQYEHKNTRNIILFLVQKSSNISYFSNNIGYANFCFFNKKGEKIAKITSYLSLLNIPNSEDINSIKATLEIHHDNIKRKKEIEIVSNSFNTPRIGIKPYSERIMELPPEVKTISKDNNIIGCEKNFYSQNRITKRAKILFNPWQKEDLRKLDKYFVTKNEFKNYLGHCLVIKIIQGLIEANKNQIFKKNLFI